MNIEQAKRTALTVILEKMNFLPAKETDQDAWYYSPFRQEKTPSFHVVKRTNRWRDFGEGTGGDGLDLVRRHLELSGKQSDQSAALRWLNNMVANAPIVRTVSFSSNEATASEKALKIISIQPIKHVGLIRYIEQRGIDMKAARSHLKQLWLLNNNTGKKFYALGIKNEENGYELRNPYFKGCVGKKHISFIRGTTPKPDGIHVFEGMFDYLTFLTIKKTHQNDLMILNSISNLQLGTAYINGYGYKEAYTWLHNDPAGENTTRLLGEFFKTQENLTHKKMNAVYAPHKDLNAWHMDNLTLEI